MRLNSIYSTFSAKETINFFRLHSKVTKVYTGSTIIKFILLATQCNLHSSLCVMYILLWNFSFYSCQNCLITTCSVFERSKNIFKTDAKECKRDSSTQSYGNNQKYVAKQKSRNASTDSESN